MADPPATIDANPGADRGVLSGRSRFAVRAASLIFLMIVTVCFVATFVQTLVPISRTWFHRWRKGGNQVRSRRRACCWASIASSPAAQCLVRRQGGLSRPLHPQQEPDRLQPVPHVAQSLCRPGRLAVRPRPCGSSCLPHAPRPDGGTRAEFCFPLPICSPSGASG